jgi:hypothetical protein
VIEREQVDQLGSVLAEALDAVAGETRAAA